MKKFACKAIFDKDTTSNTGFDWASSRRCILKVAEDHFEIDNRKILYSDIQKAKLRIVPSAFFIPGCILSISTASGSTHHFGLRYSSYWEKDFGFPIELEKVTVPILWLRRTIIVAVFIWFIWYMWKSFQYF